jgi:hypothetical protein
MLMGVVALGLNSLIPRLLAYWQLHGAATGFANYALCMVGPTGPVLLKDRPGEFWRLVRRRLVAAPAEARPFAACSPLLEAFPEAAQRLPVHQARAEEFREYATLRSTSRASLSLGDLQVTSARLEELADAARPFAAADYAELVVASRTARGAPHPVELPKPTEGHGLPALTHGYSASSTSDGGYLLVSGVGDNLRAFHSVDGGTSWSPAPAHTAAARAGAGRCSVSPDAPAFKLTLGHDQLRIESWRAAESEASFVLGAAGSQLLGFACDRAAALAIVQEPGQPRPVLRLCPHLGRCRDLNLPAELREAIRPEASLAVARVRGVAVLAMAHQGIVRVVSSRDDGETWTPSVVAYDHEEHAHLSRAQQVPARLLALDDRVLMYAGSAQPRSGYPVLVSDDYGASWQTP